MILPKLGMKRIPPLGPDGIYEIVIRPGNQKTTIKIVKRGTYTRADGTTGAATSMKTRLEFAARTIDRLFPARVASLALFRDCRRARGADRAARARRDCRV